MIPCRRRKAEVISNGSYAPVTSRLREPELPDDASEQRPTQSPAPERGNDGGAERDEAAPV